MSKLSTTKKHGTKGEVKVYLSCHPDDLKMALRELRGDILGALDCTIYYDADMYRHPTKKDISGVLIQMDAVIVVATKN